MLPIDAPWGKKYDKEDKSLTERQKKTLKIVSIIALLSIIALTGSWIYRINKEAIALHNQGGYYTVEGWKNLPSHK